MLKLSGYYDVYFALSVGKEFDILLLAYKNQLLLKAECIRPNEHNPIGCLRNIEILKKHKNINRSIKELTNILSYYGTKPLYASITKSSKLLPIFLKKGWQEIEAIKVKKDVYYLIRYNPTWDKNVIYYRSKLIPETN